ncbi:hypothetical protein DSM43518_00540 [Mycobacterium marinum]|nr:hypothetical protein DSM43518_00540 [Mycobacterium marinum]RFZ19480.1 hypothetical protein DSM43519_04002 [Mycobacterium marinum]RFZ25092.1 hypothetical protein NCTC2275_05161 [Mycobacterium marinum]
MPPILPLPTLPEPILPKPRLKSPIFAAPTFPWPAFAKPTLKLIDLATEPRAAAGAARPARVWVGQLNGVSAAATDEAPAW